ncbi:MAG: hypothetical protein CUN54_09445 [Phototrophicales bacterium]|nr:MAG: hypothetical protein CUN54_09445 [Phototrophicales bacterium]
MSPTVLRDKGYRFVIYTHDHEPAHVHVMKAENEAVVDIRPDVSLRNNYGFKSREIKDILQITEDNVEYLRDEWDRIHADE